MINKTFRLFISSTFSDFNQERRLLQTYVFPEIKKHAISKGFTFQAIDLRWGVSNEAQLDQKALELCLEEVKASKSQPHPNFLIMAGDRYGWVPTPYAIKQQDEYDKIYEFIQKNKRNIEIEYWSYTDEDGNIKQTDNRKTNSLELLDQWYKLDKNQLPASYILQERTKNEYGDYLIYENWGSEENHLRDILQEAVNHIDLSDEDKEKYFISATEHEVVDGIFKYLKQTPYQLKLKESNPDYEEDDYKHVYGYIRNIQTIKDKVYTKNFKEENSKVEEFKNRLKESINKSNLFETTANLVNLSKGEKNGSLNYSYEAIENEEDSLFVQTMIKYLKSSIDAFPIKEHNKEELEDFEQERFKDEKLKLFIGREKPLEAIDNYITNDNSQAFVLYGRSGLGKSAVMAKAIDNTIDKFKDNEKKIIYRFVGATETSNKPVSLLISILKELGISDGLKKVFNPLTSLYENEKVEEFFKRVHDYLAKIEDGIVFIDAVDQFSDDDQFLWLPIELQDNFKIVISALKDETYPHDSKYFESINTKTENLYLLESFEKPKEMVLSILEAYKRKVTDSQMMYLLEQEDSTSPLYLFIAAQELRHWKDSDTATGEIPDQSLASTQKEVINEYISNLHEIYHHDKELIKRVFAFLFLTGGLSESELLEVLSLDEEFVSSLAPDTFHNNNTNELPIVVWARLHTQIKEFLKIESHLGLQSMNFFHREFKNAIYNRYDLPLIQEELISFLQVLISSNQDKKFNKFGHIYVISLIDQLHNSGEFDKLEKYIEFISSLENIEWIKQMALTLKEIGSKMSNSNFVLHAFLYQTLYVSLAQRLYKELETTDWKMHYTIALSDYALTKASLQPQDKEAFGLLSKAVNLSVELMHENSESIYKKIYFQVTNNLAFTTAKINIDGSVRLFENLFNEVSSVYEGDQSFLNELVEIYMNYASISSDESLKVSLWNTVLEKLNEIDVESEKFIEYESVVYAYLAEHYVKIDIILAIQYQTKALETSAVLYAKDELKWREIYAEYLLNLASLRMGSNDLSSEVLDNLNEAKQIFKDLLVTKKVRVEEFYNACIEKIKEYEKLINLSKIISVNSESDEFNLQNLFQETQNIFLKEFSNIELDNIEQMNGLIQNPQFKSKFLNWLIFCSNLAVLFFENEQYGEAHEFSEIFIDCCGSVIGDENIKATEMKMIEVYQDVKHAQRTNHIRIKNYNDTKIVGELDT